MENVMILSDQRQAGFMSADNLENGDTRIVQYKHAAGQMYRLEYIRQSAIGTAQ